MGNEVCKECGKILTIEELINGKCAACGSVVNNDIQEENESNENNEEGSNDHMTNNKDSFYIKRMSDDIHFIRNLIIVLLVLSVIIAIVYGVKLGSVSGHYYRY